MVIPLFWVCCFCKWTPRTVWVRLKAFSPWLVSLFLLKKEGTFRILCRGGEQPSSYLPTQDRWLGGGSGFWGWGRDNSWLWTSWETLLIFIWVYSGSQARVSILCCYSASSLLWETSRERRSRASNHKALLKMESLADLGVPLFTKSKRSSEG